MHNKPTNLDANFSVSVQSSLNAVVKMLHINYCIGFLVAIVTVTAYDSGEFYHKNFVPFHSEEEDYYVRKPSRKPNYKCFGYHNYPILNNYPIRPKPAPPAPYLDDLDSLYVPKAKKARFFDTFDDDDDVDIGSEPPKKVPFDVCFELCPSPKNEKLVCGSDGKTYTNIHKLNCAVKCGIGKQNELILCFLSICIHISFYFFPITYFLNTVIISFTEVRFKAMGDCYTGRTRSSDFDESTFDYDVSSDSTERW